ncbi:MAG TPA: hypothetical protein VMF66_00600 [Candidatus Acidoferrum sp.]|nr:hypothetical protein [Candidatus Acidoferrum sp.]
MATIVKRRIVKKVRSGPRPETSSALPTIILMLAAILAAVYCIVFGLQTLVWFEAHHWANANPWINDVPKPLTSSPVADGNTQLQAFGFQFKVPWPGKPKTDDGPGYTEFHFDSGPVIMFFDPQGQADVQSKLNSEDPTEYQRLASAFGGQTFTTNYSIYQTVYNASPASVSPWSSAADAVRMNQLLLWKIAFGADAEPGLHSIHFGSNEGFEFGDPSSGRPVALRLFDGRDRQFRLVFMNPPGAKVKFAQADIDSAVQSLEPIPIVEPESKPAQKPRRQSRGARESVPALGHRPRPRS